jgi:hypothetical protein
MSTITHAKVSAKSDGGDSTLVLPSDWNAAHVDGWTWVIKGSDENVTSSTTLQNDDELFFTAASGTVYEIEIILVYSSPVGAGTPDIKVALGEDSTSRGLFTEFGYFTTTDGKNLNFAIDGNQTDAPSAGTSATKRALIFKGWYTGNGGTFRVLWAQNTSDANATRVHQNSSLRYRTIA